MRPLICLFVVAGCSGKVTDSDSRILETFEVASGKIALQSSYAAGISKGRSTGKWGLGASKPGAPFASHAGELVIDSGHARKTVYLCSHSWGSSDFPGLEEKELLARLEQTGAASFRDREPELERCVREFPDRTVVIARCRIDPKAQFGAWRAITIKPGRDGGIRADFVTGKRIPERCEDVMAQRTRPVKAPLSDAPPIGK